MANKTATKDLTPKPSKIVWKAVEPRHYQRAQDYLKDSKAAYTAYVLRLVETVDGNLVALPGLLSGDMPPGAALLTKAQQEQVLADFETRFAPKEGGK